MRSIPAKSSVRAVATLLALSLAIFIPSFASAEDQGQGKEGNNGQAIQKNDQSPQVRFGNPTRTISSDADQRDYDQQDGGISGVTIVGSRVFEMAPVTSATPKSTATTVLNLIKHSGSAMPETHLYAIYWGSGFPQGYATSVNSFLNSVGTDPYSTVTKQYMSNSANANIMSFQSSTYSDLSTPPSASPTTASILAEVYKVVVTIAKQSIDPKGLYMVFTSNYPSSAGYCAWHGAGSVSSSPTFTIAYQPFVGGVAGCAANYLQGYSATTSKAVDSVANVATHEIYETVTDPLLNAWYDSKGAEIGDKCAWKTAVRVAGYYVQTEWDNSITGCKLK